jgi:DNA-binding NarL/FixJ family response regulator
VLVADDHPMFRDAVKHAIEKVEEFTVVGEAGDGIEAVRLAVELLPHVVVLDIGLPLMGGVDVAREIKSSIPHTLVVALSVHDNAQHVKAMLGAGADAYLTKDVLARDLVEALRQVVSGNMYLCPSALRNLVRATLAQGAPGSIGMEHALTPREVEIVRLLARGLSNREIADNISVSTTTVKGHVEGILSKLGVESRAGAVGAAVRAGVLRIDDL